MASEQAASGRLAARLQSYLRPLLEIEALEKEALVLVGNPFSSSCVSGTHNLRLKMGIFSPDYTI